MISKWQVKDHEAEAQLFNRRLIVAGVLVILLFAALIAKIVNLQVYQFDYFSSRSDGNRLHSQYVPPARGLIYDRSGTLLADNQPIFNLTVVREQIEDMDATLGLLSSLIRLSEEDIEQFNNRLSRNRVPFSSVPLRYVLTDEEQSRIAVNSHKLTGIAIEPQFVRQYPFSALTAHSVGYVSEINRDEIERMDDETRENYGGTNHIGKTGIERTYEDILHGTVGYEIVEKNNRGQVMRELDRTDPVAGQDITLHLDARLQEAAIAALGDSRGAVVAIDPSTGGILAMVSKPGFDPNLFVTGISSRDYNVLVTDEINTPLFDRAVNPYPPGSTVKPFIGLAGLQYEHVDYEFAIEDPGYFRLPGVSYRWGDYTLRTAIGGGHGHTDLQKAIFQSCDTFFYDLGNRMGIDSIHEFLSMFGFGQNFALDINYARTGVLPSRDWKRATRGEPWYPGDTINSSVGQGYMWATPLQLATAASIIANKGKVVPPRMLKEVGGVAAEPIVENAIPDVMVNDPDYWRYIEESMTMVVHRAYNDVFRDYGTAFEAIAMADREMPYKMAGKSGTAQVVGISQDIMKTEDIIVSDLNKDHGLFISFAPAENPHIEPQIAIAVFVENGEHGSSVAGPVAKQVIDTYLLDILQIDFAALEAEAVAEAQPLIAAIDE
ncbi:MAG: penicillin-binding protein 2 [Gammaproteobacteria bacterium]|jgi:penicillin-binding protein 2|nr:penicillin-binding protein 2 [Gammaproteobacteria bacterium]MBT3858906.1 penicillin-binding protein 2 [Gammaproteobacteria bacterium]MBT3988234.1 penicillin-binding protein 2 [Gammaproteobacteria bacterium]MBT4255584.1 penicillin-binding protein 2 [Gammaproteobacteria bacterium]MBT4582504.1 penicillin-binding protein 2 [Gammaproteobacteria bacterium]